MKQYDIILRETEPDEDETDWQVFAGGRLVASGIEATEVDARREARAAATAHATPSVSRDRHERFTVGDDGREFQVRD